MGKVFSRPEKASIYHHRVIAEIEQLGINSIPLTAIISIFIGAVIALQMSISLESPFIPQLMIGYATREVMILEFSSTVTAIMFSTTLRVAESLLHATMHFANVEIYGQP